MNFKLSTYIIPSVISMVLVGTYTNIDGLFIGNVSGDPGLAAINIAWPIVALITAIGVGLGTGGSVLLNNLRGQGENEKAEDVKKSIIFLLTVIGLIVSVFSTAIYAPLLKLMGAADDVLSYAKDYSLIISVGAVFQVLGAGLVVLLRNEQKTYLSMVYTVVGLVVHVILAALLVKPYELYGVAIATVASQAVTMVLCLVSIRCDKASKVNKGFFGEILKGSTAPMGLNFVPSAVLLFTNYFALEIGGTAMVSAYAVMSYAVYTFDYVFQGVCDGIQPVVSFCSGSGDMKGERRALRCAIWLLLVLSLCFSALTPLLIAFLPKFFAVSPDAEAMMQTGLWIYAVSYPLKAAVKLICSYYYARKEVKISNALTYLDPLLLTPLFLFILPKFFEADGVWWALVFAQAAVTVLGTLTFLPKKSKELSCAE